MDLSYITAELKIANMHLSVKDFDRIYKKSIDQRIINGLEEYSVIL